MGKNAKVLAVFNPKSEWFQPSLFRIRSEIVRELNKDSNILHHSESSGTIRSMMAFMSVYVIDHGMVTERRKDV